METNIISLLNNVLSAQGIDIQTITDHDSGIEFDKGIRRQLFIDYDYSRINSYIMQNCKEKYVYVITDQFEVHYIIFKLPERDVFEVIGPYIGEEQLPDPGGILEGLKVSLFHLPVLQNYYYGIPRISNIEQIIFVFFKHLYGNDYFEIDRTGLNLYEDYSHEKERLEDKNLLSMHMVEERYACEDRLLEAVSQGDITKASMCIGVFGSLPLPPRSMDSMRERKNMTMVMNVLFRKAVQKAKVHPAHIDEVSTAFAKRIENCRNINEMYQISGEMLRKYCMLVQNYSMRGYSEMIEGVINYIDFHLSEAINLKLLADHFSLNASYLSRLFKKETGKTLTDYMNEKRIESSLVFLTTTNLPVWEVASRVGIYDENYFSRIFKKIKGITPREYRNLVNNDEI